MLLNTIIFNLKYSYTHLSSKTHMNLDLTQGPQYVVIMTTTPITIIAIRVKNTSSPSIVLEYSVDVAQGLFYTSSSLQSSYLARLYT